MARKRAIPARATRRTCPDCLQHFGYMTPTQFELSWPLHLRSIRHNKWIYATAGAFAFEIVLPIGVRLFTKAPFASDYQPWFVFGLGVLGVIVMAFIVAEPIRIRRDHWRHAHRYPPLWFRNRTVGTSGCI